MYDKAQEKNVYEHCSEVLHFHEAGTEKAYMEE